MRVFPHPVNVISKQGIERLQYRGHMRDTHTQPIRHTEYTTQLRRVGWGWHLIDLCSGAENWLDREREFLIRHLSGQPPQNACIF